MGGCQPRIWTVAYCSGAASVGRYTWGSADLTRRVGDAHLALCRAKARFYKLAKVAEAAEGKAQGQRILGLLGRMGGYGYARNEIQAWRRFQRVFGDAYRSSRICIPVDSAVRHDGRVVHGRQQTLEAFRDSFAAAGAAAPPDDPRYNRAWYDKYERSLAAVGGHSRVRDGPLDHPPHCRTPHNVRGRAHSAPQCVAVPLPVRAVEQDVLRRLNARVTAHGTWPTIDKGPPPGPIYVPSTDLTQETELPRMQSRTQAASSPVGPRKIGRKFRTCRNQEGELKRNQKGHARRL